MFERQDRERVLIWPGQTVPMVSWMKAAIAESRNLRDVLGQVEMVAPRGTGKEAISEMIHNHRPRRDKPLIEVMWPSQAVCWKASRSGRGSDASRSLESERD
jgi:DNA-binding NtrC family response regulator